MLMFFFCLLGFAFDNKFHTRFHLIMFCFSFSLHSFTWVFHRYFVLLAYSKKYTHGCLAQIN